MRNYSSVEFLAILNTMSGNGFKNRFVNFYENSFNLHPLKTEKTRSYECPHI